MSLRKIAAAIFSTMAISIMLFTTLYTLFLVVPAIESKYFPVVSKLRILEIREVEGNSRIFVEFTKLRDCEYVGTSWFRGPRDNFERVRVLLLREDADQGSPNRPVGTQRGGPWLIYMSPHDLMRNSFAILSHKCTFFWVTQTEVWP